MNEKLIQEIELQEFHERKYYIEILFKNYKQLSIQLYFVFQRIALAHGIKKEKYAQ